MRHGSLRVWCYQIERNLTNRLDAFERRLKKRGMSMHSPAARELNGMPEEVWIRIVDMERAARKLREALEKHRVQV